MKTKAVHDVDDPNRKRSKAQRADLDPGPEYLQFSTAGLEITYEAARAPYQRDAKEQSHWSETITTANGDSSRITSCYEQRQTAPEPHCKVQILRCNEKWLTSQSEYKLTVTVREQAADKAAFTLHPKTGPVTVCAQVPLAWLWSHTGAKVASARLDSSLTRKLADQITTWCIATYRQAWQHHWQTRANRGLVFREYGKRDQWLEEFNRLQRKIQPKEEETLDKYEVTALALLQAFEPCQ